MAESDPITGKSPAFQFYPNDFLSDRNVVVMSMQERGVYITLICHAWQSPLPSDVGQLARICGTPLSAFRKLWPALAICFRPHPDNPAVIIHPRLERERQKQLEYRQKQSERGRASGAARRKHGEPDANAGSILVEPNANGGSTSVEPSAVELLSSSSSSSSSSDFSRERPRPRPVMGGGAGVGSNPRDHLYCRGNGTRCSRICVSEKQHAILRAKFGGDERTSDDALDAFYAEVRSRLDPNQPIGDTPWKFWEAQFAAKFGTVAVVNPRTAGNVAAAARFVARGQQ